MSVVERAAQVLWGIHEEAADCSHQPEHVRRLFIDANAAHRFAQALADAGLLVTDEMLAAFRSALDDLFVYTALAGTLPWAHLESKALVARIEGRRRGDAVARPEGVNR